MTNAAPWRGLLAGGLALTFILAILGTVPGQGEEGARPGIADRCLGGDCASRPVRGVTVYRGLVLDYEVIDGLAVHGGDMVLGTAEEAAAAAPSREPTKREASPGPVRRDLNPIENSRLWPGGRVPYVIGDAIKGEDLEVVHAAIEHWNTKTVIDWFPRTDEQDYALFLPKPEEAGACRSDLGVGSPTEIVTGGCHLGIVVHEMGHAVGLLHEHDRPDWGRFLDEEPFIFSVYAVDNVSRWLPDPRGDAPELPYPYDYRSIMHYRLGRVTTIPPGIGVSGFIYGRSLSPGDIDGVARLYGKHPGTITVSTNPPGLDVIVDGDRVTAPALLEWTPDSVHTLEAPLEQRQGRYVFGRWSDGGGRKHSVRAGPDSTWFEANFIRLYQVPNNRSSGHRGNIAVSPESPDGLHAPDSLFELTPVPTEGTPYEFARWDLSHLEWLFPGAQPAYGSGLRPTVRTYVPSTIRAVFRAPPLYRIDSNVEGMLLPFEVNGTRSFAPAAFQPAELPAGTTVSVPESGPVLDRLGSSGRYRFTGWSDGGEREHEIEAPAVGGSLTFQMQREFQLATHTNSGEIVVSPASEDGFYPAGSQVQLTAVPEAGRHALGWEHDVSGTETTQFVIMDRDRRASAKFTRDEPILVQFGEPLQADSLDGRHYVRVPDGTSQIAVRFASPAPSRDAEFYITPAFSPSAGSSFEFGSTRLGESDTITLTREALSRLRDRARRDPRDRSHHLQIVQRGSGVGGGTLHVSIERDWIARVWPRAFTLVSQVGWPRPVQQTMRVVPVEGELPQVRYRIVANQPWLEAFPQEWTSAQGEVEIAVSANAAALASEAYGGTLQILTVRDGDPPTGGTPTGIEIPVHFVVKPADGAEEPPGDESSGLTGGDDHGNTRGAATQIAAGSAAQGRLERIGDEDWFRFRTTAARTWVTAYIAPRGNTLVELYVHGSDSPLADVDSLRGTNIRLRAEVPAGIYYVRVRERVRGYGTPDYTLTLEAAPDDHSNTKESATEIAVGASAGGRLEPDSDEDWFQFQTTAAHTWVTAYTAPREDTLVELYVGGVTPVAPHKLDSSIFGSTAGVPAGTHYVRVSRSRFGAPDYTLTLKETLDAMEFVRIPAGNFVMGSPKDERGRRSAEGQHEVQLSQAFWMGKYEVTQAEWADLMGSDVDCAPCAVVRSSWEEVQEFIRRLNERESGKGYRYRLPTEAEWEYAARAGSTGARHGELIDSCRLYRTFQTLLPVGQKRANAWGLHDMLGNVSEWTSDWFGEYPTTWVTDPQGPSTGSFRVYRGGGDSCRFAARGFQAYDESVQVGFRLVRTQAGGSSGIAAEDDHGDTRGTATEVALGASAHGRIERVGDADWFRFQTTAARTSVTAYTVSEGETAGELHIAGGGTVTDDGSSKDGNFSIVADVPAGTHYLRVTGFGTPTYTLTLKDVLGAMEFVRIPAGRFVMGSPEDEDGHREGSEDQHLVQLSQAFWMGKYEVTQREWEAVMGENPSEFLDCEGCPVERVSWVDVQEFIQRLNERGSGSGYVYRLPTEAEWEYAARAGTTGARYGALDEIAWYGDNSGGTTHPVGQKRANAWGLHDMLGNVAEWVGNWLYVYPSGPVTDPQGPSTGHLRMMRGGDFRSNAQFVRSAYRDRVNPHFNFTGFGFRLVRTE